MRADAASAAELAEALEQDPSDGGNVRCWKALARVVNEEPSYVFQEGDANGMTVTAMILTGPFVGCEIQAMVASPLGAGFESRPITAGQRILVDMLDGRPDGLNIATATVPGGRENPLPKAMAGLAVDEGGLQNSQLVAPPKGVNLRFYIRGAAFVVRLKGAQEGYAGEFYLEADDGDEDGLNNTFLRMVLNPTTKKMAIKAKLSDGTALELNDGIASLSSGETSLEVHKDQIRALTKTFYIGAETIVMNGTVLANLPPGAPPIPDMAVLHGVAGPKGIPSLSFFVGR